jgi:carbamoyl-phosphate synthase large subunit
VRVVGLAYDALDPGIYAEGLVREVFMIPYPSQGDRGLPRDRLAYVREKVGLDVIVPTLDAELPAPSSSSSPAARMGIGMLLPTREQLEQRSKVRSPSSATRRLSASPSLCVSDVEELSRAHEKVPYPLFVKGVYYGATLVAHTLSEAIAAFYKVVGSGACRSSCSTYVPGEEFNVCRRGRRQGRDARRGADEEDGDHRQGQGLGGHGHRRPGLLSVARQPS